MIIATNKKKIPLDSWEMFNIHNTIFYLQNEDLRHCDMSHHKAAFTAILKVNLKIPV